MSFLVPSTLTILVLFKINKERGEFKKMESSLPTNILSSLADSTNNHAIECNKESPKRQANDKRKTYAAKAQPQSTNKTAKNWTY